jgi:hypothetical protein
MINRNKKLKRELKQAVERKRRRKAAATPCPECGEKPLSDDPMSRVRLMAGPDVHPCARCHDVAAENGFQIVEMLLARGLADGPATRGSFSTSFEGQQL